jgi:WD40 repeat protein
MRRNSSIRGLVTLAVLFTVTMRCRAADEPLSRVQIARIGKAATALVEVKAARQGSGSAFCIHPSGWFLTNAHVVQGELTLVLNPTPTSEKSYSARVVRSDPELDLALLRVDGVKDLPALALGSDEGLEELQDVVGIGFPLGKDIAGGEIPAVSVSPGSINALRHKDGRLHRIQLDGAVAPGSSGGPVLDQRGRVIGVVASGVTGTGLNFAIPVSAVKRFLERPEVRFSPPPLGSAALHKPVRFDARVTPLLPSAAPLTVELILKAGKGPERTARMEADGDRYRLTAVPNPGRRDPVMLRLMARFEDGSLEATTTDRTFTAGGREVALADVRTIWPGSPARVSLRDGTTISGGLSGLDAVPVRLSEQTLSVDLNGMREVSVTPVGHSDRVACTLVVRQGEKEIYRQSHGLGSSDLSKIVEVARFRGHGANPNCVAASPDGRRLLSCSNDGTMILWDRDTGSVLRRLQGQGGNIYSVCFSPDGRRALSGGADTIVRLWDLESGVTIREFRGHPELVSSVAFSPDGRLAYSTSGGYPGEGLQDGRDCAIRVWDVETGREVRKLQGHRGLPGNLAVSPDGRRVLSGGHDMTVILWDAVTGAEIRRFRGHTGDVGCVAFLPDGLRAVSISIDRTIRLWDVENGQEIHCMREQSVADGVDGWPTWLAVSPDGRRLLSSSTSRRVLLLWDLEACKLLHRLDWGNLGPIRGCFTPDGHHAAWSFTDGIVRVYRLLPPDEPTTSVSAVTQPTGTWLASLPRSTWPATVVLAVLPVIMFFYARRRQWWGPFGSRRKRFAMGASTATGHPDAAILALFASGRLRSSEMKRLGEHLAECSVCLEVLEQLPEDPMVGMLRNLGDWSDGSPAEPGAGEYREERPGRFNGVAPHPPEVPGDPGWMRPVEEDDEQVTPGPIANPRYELKTLLGSGGMGLIYLAHDHQENRAVVLKFLRESLLDRPRLVERFRREAAAATLLKHPNIVEAYGAEPFGRWPALVMEYIRGTDLASLIERTGPVPVRVGCELIRQAAMGLQYSFERGMVHRDIKPSNLMVSTDGTVKILDFGLAKLQSELSIDAGLTSTGAFLGSVDYMAPEQADDPRLADIRADIYSLGCTFYHLLSGGPPFQGTTLEVLGAHRSLKAPPLNERRPEVSPELAVLVAGMMAREPGRRFQTPGQVAMALMTFLEA